MSLPRKVGPFTLMRKLSADAVAESYVAILDAPAGKQVVVRRVLPTVGREASRLASLRSRAGDLRSVRAHPGLARVQGAQEIDGDLYVVEDQPEGVELGVLVASVAAGQPIPHNVYLQLAAQLCNALEALHANPGIETGSEHVLHLALSPSTVWVTGDGRLTLGRYGLTRSPTALATMSLGGGATGTGSVSPGALPSSIEYLSPEQTHQDQKLLPASDLFSLGALLYELLTGRSLFRAETNLQTIHRLRRAEVTTQLLEVKEILPGLDRVLFRSLSLNPRHRYQRAFVLREDLRGLMANYSFSDIEPATREYLEPALSTAPIAVRPLDGSALGAQYHAGPGSGAARETTAALLRGVPNELRDSPVSEPREVGPDDPEHLEPDGDGGLGDGGLGDGGLGDGGDEGPDTNALLDDTGTLLRSDTDLQDRRALLDEPLREDTAWSPNARAALRDSNRPSPGTADARSTPVAPGHRRALEPIDTARRTRDELEPPPPPPRRALADDLPVWGADARGDTLPFPFENTRPSAERTDHTGDSADSPDTGPVPYLGPPSNAPDPNQLTAKRTPPPAPSRAAPPAPQPPPRSFQSAAATELPSSELRSVDLQTASGPILPDPPSGPVQAPLDFAASLAEDTGLHPLRRDRPAAAPDLRPTGPSELTEPDPGSAAFPPPRAPRTPPPPSRTSAAAQEPYRVDFAEVPAEDPPATRSYLAPALGLAVVALLVGAAVFVCVGGGGLLGIVGWRQGQPSDGRVAAIEARPAQPAPAPQTERIDAAAAAEPAVPEPAPVPLAEPLPEPEPAPPPRPATARQKALDVDLTPPRPAPPRETFEAVARAARPAPAPVPPPRPAPPPPRPAPPPTPDPVAEAELPPPPPPVGAAELDAWSPDAFAGRLAPDARGRMGELPATDPEFTRAQTLLLLDAKARGDGRGRDAAMAALMGQPENRYNPALLVEQAELQVERRQWRSALETAKRAEQHWARLPSELVWSRKAMMYELQALANTGLFYDSEGDDLIALQAAIRDWERFEGHVATGDRADLAARAAGQLSKLRAIQDRLAGSQR